MDLRVPAPLPLLPRAFYGRDPPLSGVDGRPEWLPAVLHPTARTPPAAPEPALRALREAALGRARTHFALVHARTLTRPRPKGVGTKEPESFCDGVVGEKGKGAGLLPA